MTQSELNLLEELIDLKIDMRLERWNKHEQTLYLDQLREVMLDNKE